MNVSTHEVGTPRPPKIPDTVPTGAARSTYAGCIAARQQIQDVAQKVDFLRDAARSLASSPEGLTAKAVGETNANIALSFRHIEDASMRLGCAMRNLDSGTTADSSAVGAIRTPDARLTGVVDLGFMDDCRDWSPEKVAEMVNTAMQDLGVALHTKIAEIRRSPQA